VKLDELTDHVANFQRRVLADALQEATAAYWTRRAEAFEAAIPRESDYRGRASDADVEEQRYRLAASALACRQRAQVSLGGGIE